MRLENTNPSSIIQDTINGKEEIIHDFSKKLAYLSEDTINKVEQAVSAMQEHAKEYSATAEHYVRKNPLTSLGIAVAAGLIIGAIIKP